MREAGKFIDTLGVTVIRRSDACGLRLAAIGSNGRKKSAKDALASDRTFSRWRVYARTGEGTDTAILSCDKLEASASRKALERTARTKRERKSADNPRAGARFTPLSAAALPRRSPTLILSDAKRHELARKSHGGNGPISRAGVAVDDSLKEERRKRREEQRNERNNGDSSSFDLPNALPAL